FLRRRRAAEPSEYRFGDCVLDMSADRLTRDGAEVPLTPKESGLLKLMVSRADRALTRDEILHRVWGYDVFVTARSIDRCVNTLRKKIEPDPKRPTFIKTIREIGYRFEIPENA
ncbi:MAG: winged helix-turn-helix domain-containing protein, partial [Phycisphaerae bacterium]|nr:winged helix-turn-helix domain-containing protein [Phycisphaerae bacterium]